MTLEMLRAALGWCSLINLALLTFWLLALTFAREWVHAVHRRWFDIERPAFDAIHYAGLGLFKLGIVLFNLVPYLALRIVA